MQSRPCDGVHKLTRYSTTCDTVYQRLQNDGINIKSCTLHFKSIIVCKVATYTMPCSSFALRLGKAVKALDLKLCHKVAMILHQALDNLVATLWQPHDRNLNLNLLAPYL